MVLCIPVAYSQDVYKRQDTDCSRNWHTFIHPLQAVMLSFFTYDRPLQTTLPLLCDFFCRSKEEMCIRDRWITANQTGMIDRFFVENQSPVQKNDTLGILKNTALLEDVQTFCRVLTKIEWYYQMCIRDSNGTLL